MLGSQDIDREPWLLHQTHSLLSQLLDVFHVVAYIITLNACTTAAGGKLLQLFKVRDCRPGPVRVPFTCKRRKHTRVSSTHHTGNSHVFLFSCLCYTLYELHWINQGNIQLLKWYKN